MQPESKLSQDGTNLRFKIRDKDVDLRNEYKIAKKVNNANW